MNQSAIGWIALAIAVFVFLDLLIVELRRIVREGGRIVARVIAYGDLPVVDRATRAGDDVERISCALERVAPLVTRGQRALARIRDPLGRAQAPFVPNGSDASNGLSVD